MQGNVYRADLVFLNLYCTNARRLKAVKSGVGVTYGLVMLYI